MTFFDPAGWQMSLRMITSEGAFPLWMDGNNNENGKSIFHNDQPFKDLTIVKSVEMEINRGYSGKLTVQISAPYDLGLALLDSELFRIGNTLECQLGYPKFGLFTPWFAGMTLKPSLSLNPADGLTATLNVDGANFAAHRSTDRTTYTGSYRDMINLIANRNKWYLDIPPRPAGLSQRDEIDVVRGGVSQGSRTDWLFIQHIARDAGYDAYLLPFPEGRSQQKLVVEKRSDTLAREPKLTFVARGDPDFDATFPLLSIETEAEGIWAPELSGTVHSADIDPDNRGEPVEAEVNPTTDQAASTGTTMVGVGEVEIGGHRIEGRRGGVDAWIPQSHRSPNDSQAILRAHSAEAAMRAAINLTITSYGIPDLFPNRTVRVENVGVFSGNYGIDGITHSASESGWNMSIKLIANALFEDALSVGFSVAAPNPNVRHPTEETPSAGTGENVVEAEEDDF